MRVLFIIFAGVVACMVIACRKTDRVDAKEICRIELQRTYVAEGIMNRYFRYNKWDDPVEVYFEEYGTGRETFIFTYDKQNRLIHYRGYTEHFFSYDRSGHATIDTIHSNYAGQDQWFAEKLYYDKQGRIIKTETKLYSSPYPDAALGVTATKEYHYDAKGNLIRPNFTHYDDKISIFRTNKVWMLVHKDYSVNNAIYDYATEPIAYNSFGLPLRGHIGLLNHAVEETVYNCGKTAVKQY